jgi:hypothetical protein
MNEHNSRFSRRQVDLLKQHSNREWTIPSPPIRSMGKFPAFFVRLAWREGAFVLGLLIVILALPAWGADGVIYYSSIPTLNGPAALRRVNADGSGDQGMAVNLPAPVYPTASRDGRRLLLTSQDPGRPFKISNNAFTYDIASATTAFVTHFEDIVMVNGVLLTNNVGDPSVTNRNISSYTINFPNHKAFSPDGSRVVVMNLRKSGSVTRDTPFPTGETTLNAGSGRFPVVEIYSVADQQAEGSYVFLGVDRTGFNQGGDGVDWHPLRNEIVATVSADIPVTGSAGRTSTEGTILAVFTASGPSQFVRKLTTPAGQADAYFDLYNIISTAATPHDYAPSISSDGQKVAYVRHLLRQDNRYDGAGIAPLPAQCSIRVINYDGSGDREVLRLGDGLWVTKVAWSPDGSQIAFDLAPQAVANGWNSLIGDVARSEIHLVNANGTSPQRLVQASAAYPTWAPNVGNTGNPPPQPQVQARSNGQNLEMQIEKLVPGRTIRVEGTTNLLNWTTVSNFKAISSSQSVPLPAFSQGRSRFYRVAVD